MITAVADAFPHGARVSCVRHLQSNVADSLRDKVGTDVQQRKAIVNCLFGSNGVATADDSVTFDL